MPPKHELDPNKPALKSKLQNTRYRFTLYLSAHPHLSFRMELRISIR